jgi:hypothetical protein
MAPTSLTTLNHFRLFTSAPLQGNCGSELFFEYTTEVRDQGLDAASEVNTGQHKTAFVK